MSDNKNIRIKDIAEMAGVSVGTVDRVIHQRGNVSADTKKKIKKILKKTGYSPNPIAQKLGANKDYEIAAIIPDPDQDEYWKLSDKGIGQAKEEWEPYDIHVTVHTFDLTDPDTFNQIFHEVLDTKPDAVLTAPVFYDQSLLFCQHLQSKKIPYILFNTQISSQIKKYEPLCFIGQNLYQSGRVAAELMHILLQKADKLAVMHIHEKIDNAMHLKEKERGFRNYFKELNGYDYEINSFLFVDRKDSFKSQIDDCIRKNKIKGIFVPTSSGTSIAASALESHNNIHVSLVGYDLLEENILHLKKSTINFLINQNPHHQALQGIRYLANHLLLNLNVPSSDLIPLEIITRENYNSFL